MAGAAIGGAAGGAAGGLFGMVSGLVSASKQEDLAKKSMKQQRRIYEEGRAVQERASQMSQAGVDIARQNLLAGEEARSILLSRLGQPGTYRTPGAAGPISMEGVRPGGVGSMSSYRPGALLGSGEMVKSGVVTGADVKLKGTASWKGRKPWEVRGVELDPQAMAAAAEDTSAFRVISQQVAEVEQLMNRSGPVWNQLNNSVVGSIFETNAQLQRQANEQMARSLARGGTARRAGLAFSQAQITQEKINYQRTQQLWTAKLKLEEYRTATAQQVTTYAQEWVNNASGVRDSFTNSLQSLTLFWGSTMAPVLAGAASTGASAAMGQNALAVSDQFVKAAQIRSDAMSGAMQGLIGVGEQLGAYLAGDNTTETPTTAAEGTA